MMSESKWISRFAHLVRGNVLDLACGCGRHGRLFLQQGAQVTFVDKQIDGVRDLREHTAAQVVERDLEDGTNWSFAPAEFDAIIVTNYLYRPHLQEILGSLKDGGVLLYETFALGNEQFGRPRSPDFLLKPGELLDLVDGRLQVVAFEHGIDEEKAVQRICAVKTSALQKV